ncbi:MAG: hypothetical protein U5J95_01965 [Balneolaceae bacterium]|nr:hypothetical protein [Balneolaceae bacterium]
MELLDTAIRMTKKTAEIPSFSSYEERIHPFIEGRFEALIRSGMVSKIPVNGNSLIYNYDNDSELTIALTAHLDKINHYGETYPAQLPVKETETFIEGAMDNCAGLGVILALCSLLPQKNFPNLLLFFSEMEESKGLKEHPELLKNNGEGYTHGMGARKIAKACLKQGIIPDEVITVDTTPLFKGEKGVAVYSKHWELNDLEAGDSLINKTKNSVNTFLSIDDKIHLDNNTNDYLHYGFEFNSKANKDVVSLALEPAIYPYHQKGERVFKSDIERVLKILIQYLSIK